MQISLSSENTNTSRSQLSHSLLLPQFPSSHLQSVSSEFLLPQSRTTHVLLLELLSLSSPNLLCLNLQASGTVLARVHLEVDCCRSFGEGFCVLWNWNQGCLRHGSAHSSSPALFLSFLSPLLLCSQSSALHFLWSQARRWEIQHLPKLFCTSVLQCGGLSRCLGSAWRVQPLHKAAPRAAAKLRATPDWECGLWVCSWVGIPAQKYEFPSKVVNSKIKMCAVSILTVWLLTVLRDAYSYSWVKA